MVTKFTYGLNRKVNLKVKYCFHLITLECGADHDCSNTYNEVTMVQWGNYDTMR